MSEQRLDPMPEDPKKREEIKIALKDMRQHEISERGNVEQDLDLGTPAQEILQELGGVEQAERIVGKDRATKLQRQAVAGQGPDFTADDPEQQELVSLINAEMKRDAKQKAKEARDRLAMGESFEDIVEELGGFENAKRVIGEAAIVGLSTEELTQRERESWVDILDLQFKGASSAEIVSHFGGYQELERVIGTKAAASFNEEAKKEKA